MSEKSIRLIISAIDKATGPMKKIEVAINKITGASLNLTKVSAATRQVNDSMSRVTAEAGKLSAKLAVLGGGTGWFVKTQLIDTASQFENFRTVLEAVEGSATKAESSLNWVSDFAAKTPYELAEVTESFVKLRAYGINPMDGTLRTLGDTAAAMNKPLKMAAEAIADAMTGENERLKEFGINASTKGNRVRYTYSDRNGKTQAKIVNNRRDREQVRATLLTIWNERYAGAMDKMSRTYTGMMSNLKDQWTRFKMLVMQNGAFDFIKEKLAGILRQVDAMAANGQLKKLADQWGKNLTEGIKNAWSAAVGFWKVLQGIGQVISWVANLMGGYKNLGIAIASMMALKLVASIVMTMVALTRLGVRLAQVTAQWLAYHKVAYGGANAGQLGDMIPGPGGSSKLAKVGRFAGRALAVGAAAEGGWQVGSYINRNFVDGTAIGDAIGEGLNRIAAALGNKESKLAIEINSGDGSSARVTSMQSHGMAVNVHSGLIMAGH